MNIKDLPSELRELALLRRAKETARHTYNSDEKIYYMFNWANTPEFAIDDSFWNEVDSNKNIEKHNEYAKTIIGALTPMYCIY